ncbi:unnamed protein product [Ambrosiozyma monospora]|uniref:Protein transport protein SFT2 n=1 Tax=Ambrosiozyma monospora TaxID=43982 RepID=A0A9W6WGB0_AMBMO|nr:unnamed protein product [Ambrosiozyma monospora]
MSEQNAQFLSNWRSTRTEGGGNGNASSSSEDNDGSVAGQAKSFFNTLGNKVKDSYNDAYNVLPLTNSDLTSSEPAEPSWFKLSKFERMICFFICLLGAVACFALCVLLAPVLALKPRKFAMLWTLGSLLCVVSFGCLQGPVGYIRHLFSKERLPFTLIFFSSVFLTLYCAAVLKSTVLTLISGIVEIVCIVYYTLSYFPYGAQGFQMIFSMGLRQFSGMVGL